MRRLIVTYLLTGLLAGMGYQNTYADDVYKKIDEAIALSPEYVAQYELKIGEARHALSTETSADGKFQRNFRLYELYKPFVSDSAMYFLRQCIQLADGMGNRSASVRCRSLLAIRCSNIGMYDEALNILDSISTSSSNLSLIDSLSLGTYYEAYNNVYSAL